MKGSPVGYYSIQRSLFVVCATYAFLASTSLLAGGEQFKTPELVKYKSIFLDKPPGTVAFLPRLGRSEYYNRVNEFLILPESGFYRLPTRSFYFFEVNKRMEEAQVSFLTA